MRTADERLAILDEMLSGAARRGLLMRTPSDARLDGRRITLDGESKLSFGSCSYLGLELDPRLQDAACEATLRYGTQFSSSRTYLQAPPYLELEELLSEMFGGFALMAPSTTLGHICALPVLIESADAVILDQQVHHSVQTAVNLVRVNGTVVEMIRHSALDELEAAIERLRTRHRRVWYLIDGVYSMFADYAPHAELAALLERYEQLHLYADDSHAIGWTGTHGRGLTLERLGVLERVVVAGSLNKAFAAAGGALVFPTAELRRRVRTLGGPMIFSGPVQPPMLGAAIASARIHLSDELHDRQRALRERIDHCTASLTASGISPASAQPAPIRYITLGLPRLAEDVVKRLLNDGVYTNLGMFPAVPITESGVRFTLTLHHSPADVQRLCETLTQHVNDVRAESEAAPVPLRRALRLERHGSMADVDASEWDLLLGDRGTFTAAGLSLLERVFNDRQRRPEDRWHYHYYLVRDGSGLPVLATLFTDALWKDDMLFPAAVSEQVERRRAHNPYYLTARTFAMGSLLTEGDHLYLDRTRDWKGALKLLVDAVAEDAATAGANTIVLRDLDGSDRQLSETIAEHGYVKLDMPPSLLIERLADNDEEWLRGLSQRARAHQRRNVLPFDNTLEIEILNPDSRRPSQIELTYLHRLYQNVRSRNLELNTFELPEHLWRELLSERSWELVLLRLPGRPAPVAVGAHFIGAQHYAPMILGLDYRYLESHHVYRQALRQALLRARRHGAQRVALGMGATLEKRRFGARVHARSAFVQARDHYSADLLATLASSVPAVGSDAAS